MSAETSSALLAEILADPERVDTLQAGEIAAALTELAALQMRLAARVLAGASTNGTAAAPDKLLTIEEVADRLRVAKSTVYDRAGSYPFVVRQGRALRFSARGLERYLAQQQRRR